MLMSTATERLTRKDVPIEQTWDVSDLFPTYDDWTKELEAVQQDVINVTQYKGKLGDNAKTLLSALESYDTYLERIVRVGTYANLRISTDGSDANYQADAIKFASAYAQINAKLSFLETELLTISESKLNQFYQVEPSLEIFKKMLDDIMEKKQFTLSAEVEETLAALSEVHDAPYMIYGRSKSSDMTFDSIKDSDGNELPVSETLYEDRYEMAVDTEVRRKAYDSFIKTMNKYKNTYAATYATEITKQVTMAKLRGYESVTDMRFCDLKISLDPSFNPETTYDEAKTMILDALNILGPEYSAIMEEAFNNRWVDYSDNIGKQSGAFCSSPYGAHPYILMTWTNMMRGTFTLAHELGHAGHFYLTNKNQKLVNTRPSTYFVEAPSTMNELLLADYLIENTNDERMKRWVISQLLGTYYHNFVTHLLEGEFQRRVYALAEAGTPITANILCEQKQETIENFWGDAAVIDEGAGLTWMRQPHYYMGLYPYTYSAGLTLSTAVR